MKKSILLFTIIALALSLSSCKKEKIEPVTELEVPVCVETNSVGNEIKVEIIIVDEELTSPSDKVEFSRFDPNTSSYVVDTVIYLSDLTFYDTIAPNPDTTIIGRYTSFVLNYSINEIKNAGGWFQTSIQLSQNVMHLRNTNYFNDMFTFDFVCNNITLPCDPASREEDNTSGFENTFWVKLPTQSIPDVNEIM